MQRSLSKLRNTLKKSRAKSDAYKRKAIKGHQREQLLREQLRQLVQRAEGDRKRFENEMGRLKSDLLNRATRSSENAGKENGDQLAGGGGGGGGISSRCLSSSTGSKGKRSVVFCSASTLSLNAKTCHTHTLSLIHPYKVVRNPS